MLPPDSELPVIVLKPAEVYIGDQPAIVTTILGSCVSIIFYAWKHNLGAISHALLPTGPGRKNRFRYVDGAFSWMVEQFQLRGVKMDQVQVKLFGGADVLENDKGKFRKATVGQQNIKQALELIEAHGLNLKSSNLGGLMGQKIFFYPHSGKVLVKKIEKVCWLSQKP